jgi:hypothetical protein
VHFRDWGWVMSVVSEVPVLPDGTSAVPLLVGMGSFRLELTFLEESVWDIAERVGSTRVHHGRLILQRGQFVIFTASGVQAPAPGWYQALRQHFHIH